MDDDARTPLSRERRASALDWHSRPGSDVARELSTSEASGLTSEEARRRLGADGPNELRAAVESTWLQILLRQFQSLVIWVLIAAALVSAFLGELLDGIAIVTIVVLNAVIGFAQELRAERAVAALTALAAPNARVVRDGAPRVVPARDVVRGDLLLIEGGDLVAADARLLDAAALRIGEAPLTGESEPVSKTTDPFPPETPLADRRDMVFLGTTVAAGTGRAVVVTTGMATEVGKIAGLLETARADETPLQRRLDRVARRLLWICAVIVTLVFTLGTVRGIAPFEMFLAAVSLAVAAIPEGLPAVVTIALALGVSRMVRRNALVRNLPAVETLGSAQVICTDKTGTLTVGQMTARRILTADGTFAVTGEGYGVEGSLVGPDEMPVTLPEPPLRELLLAAAACNDADLVTVDGRAAVVGDPTEGALLVAAAKGGITRDAVAAEVPRIAAIPFDSDRKRMTVVCRRGDATCAFVKGAPEVVLDRATAMLSREGPVKLDAERRARLLARAADLAREALRVLVIAERRLPDDLDARSVERDPDAIERDLTILGFVGLQDPPRREAKEAVARCKSAGIRVVMITGDHRDTAHAIGRELGILSEADEVVAGSELDRLSESQLAERIRATSVYARVTAEHKLRIVRAWKAEGAVVAMTGDGVNDAPALKEASIGIAMGITGTEATKQAADMVITDDNFASIVAAVEEGRGIYDNIAKTLAYLMAGNTGELLLMLGAVIAGWPLPLLPIQLLWINLVTDGLPALALATDAIDSDVLRRPPRRPDAEIMDRRFFGWLLLIGGVTASVALAAFLYELRLDGSAQDARNAAFTVVVFAELLKSFGLRSETRTMLELGLFSNGKLLGIVAASFVIQIAIHHVPVLERLFDTEPISARQILAWLALAGVPLLAIEAGKIRRRHVGAVARVTTTSPPRIPG